MKDLDKFLLWAAELFMNTMAALVAIIFLPILVPLYFLWRRLHEN